MSTGMLMGTPCFRPFDACHALPLRLLSFNVTKFLVKSLLDEQMDTPLKRGRSGRYLETINIYLGCFPSEMQIETSQ